jgi:dihydroorotase
MADLKEAGAIGVSDDGVCVMNAAVMRRALEYARTFDLLVSQHCEDHHLTHKADMHEGRVSTRLGLRGWPRVAEDIIVARDLLLTEAVGGARYHVAHISSMGAVRLIREAKSRGLEVTAEVTPHHLTLTDAAVLGYDTACKVNPPLREQADVDALRAALADGTIDAIATDHAPHAGDDKMQEFERCPFGITGLETALGVTLEALVHSGRIPLMRMIALFTTGPAGVLAMPRARLAQGLPGDVTVFDATLEWTYDVNLTCSRSKNTPFHGRSFRGGPMATIVAGRIVWQRPR